MAWRYPGRELELFAATRNWKRYVASLLAPYVTGRVLEVGAGGGETTRVLWRAEIASWTAVEPDPILAAQLACVRREHGEGETPEIVVGTIADVSLERLFDTILYVDVLEHIGDDWAELARAAARLAPGGRLVVLAPAYQCLFSEYDRAIGHERRYAGRALACRFPEALEREALFHADSLGVLLSLGNRLLLRQSLPTLWQLRFWDGWVVPVSRVIDWMTRRRVGRSVIGVFRKPVA